MISGFVSSAFCVFTQWSRGQCKSHRRHSAFRAESLSKDCSQFRAPCPWSLMEIALETPETMTFMFQDILFGSRRGRTRCFITGSAGQLTNQEPGSQRRVCSSQQRECGALGTPGRLGRVDPWAPDLSKSRGREDCVTMTRDKLWPWLASVQPCSKGQNEKRFPHINNNHNLSDLPNSNIQCLL